MLTDAKIAKLKPPTDGQIEHRDHKVTGLRLRIGSGGTKSWIYRARVGARTINKKLGTYPGLRLDDARHAALKIVQAIARSGSPDAMERTFGQTADLWIEKVAKLKNASWHDQKRRLELHVLPKWRDRKLLDIRRGDVRALVDDIEGVILPNRVLAVIRTVFRYALSRDWIEFSPAEGIGKPKAERARDRVLSMSELARIWSVTALLGYPFGSFVRVLILTAQRRSEVASIRWRDIDLERRIWTIPAAFTKGGRGQMVPLSPQVAAILASSPRLGDYVFTTDGETYIRCFSKLKIRVDKLLAVESEFNGWRLHDLRRSAATHMVRLGVLEEVVARILNHARQGVTARVYALHSYANEKRVALESWAAEVELNCGSDELSSTAGIWADQFCKPNH